MFNGVIVAFEKAGRCREAMRMFEEMQAAQVAPDTVTYGALISACEKMGHWEQATELFKLMQVLYSI